MSFYNLLPKNIKQHCIEFLDFYDRNQLAQCSRTEKVLVWELPTYVDEVYYSEDVLQIKEGKSNIKLTRMQDDDIVLVEVETMNKNFAKYFDNSSYIELIDRMVTMLGYETQIKTLKLEPTNTLFLNYDKFFSLLDVTYETVLFYVGSSYCHAYDFTHSFPKFYAPLVELDLTDGYLNSWHKVENLFEVKGLHGIQGLFSESDLVRFTNLTRVNAPKMTGLTSYSLIWFFRKWLRCKAKVEHKLIFSGCQSGTPFNLEPFLKVSEDRITKRSPNEYVFKKSENEYAILKTGSEIYSFCSYFGTAPVKTIEEEFENIEIEEFEQSDEDSEDDEVEEDDDDYSEIYEDEDEGEEEEEEEEEEDNDQD